MRNTSFSQWNFFLSPASLTLRLEQYLGLPPHNGKTKFVQMWVNPRDLFRPCPDSEISDTRCEVQFPQRVWRAHQYWFIDKMLTSMAIAVIP